MSVGSTPTAVPPARAPGKAVQSGSGKGAGKASTGSSRSSDLLLYVAMAVVVAFFVFPLLWVLSLSLKSVDQLFATPPVLFPTDPQWSNYTRVIDTTPMLRYLLNSTLIVASTVALTLLLAVPSAYALSRFRFRSRRVYLVATLAAQLISPIILVVPLYRLFVDLALLNSYASLVAVYAAVQLPFTTWFLKGYLDTVPTALDEAARVDGCSRLRALLQVVLPAAGPGIASVSILVAVLSWSQFVIPFVLLDDRDLFPISVGVVNLQSTTGDITLQYLAAGAVMAIVPVIVVFVLLQRFIVGALTQGAVKD
jgi:multiple sugar transport system permease protein